MDKKRTFLIAGLIALVILGGTWLFSRPQGSRNLQGNQALSQSPKHITIAQFGDLLLYLPLYIALDQGIFAKYGLNVEIVSTGGDDKTYAAVLSRSADFGIADPTFVAIARERGQKGRVVGLLIDGMPNYGVSLSQDQPLIKNPVGLKGKTVASVPAPSTSYALTKKLFEMGGLTPSIRQVAPPGLMPSLKAHEADYAILIEPWVSGVVRNGGRVAFSLMDYFPHFALTGITTSEDIITSDPNTALKVVQALTESVAVFYEKPEIALHVAQTRFPGEAIEDLKMGIERMRADNIYPHTEEITSEAWMPAINLRHESGDLKNLPASMDTYVDNQFAMQAKAK